MSGSNVVVNFLGDSKKLDKTLNGVESRLGKLGKVVGAAAIAAGAATVAVAATSVKAYADFDGKMREVYTLMPGISQKAMRGMEDDVFSLSKRFGILPNDVIPALYDSLSAGVPPGNVFDFLETSTKFAKAGATDVSTAVDGLTTVVNAFGMESSDAGRAADVLFTAVKAGKTTVPELSASMFQVAPIAAAMGVSIEEVAAGFASLTAQGVPTAQAATQMKAAFAELGKQGTKADKAFRDISGTSFPEFIKGGGSVEQALNMLAQGAEDSGISVVDMFGSIEAGQAVLGLTGEQADRFRDNLGAMGESAGAVDEAFKVMDTGLMATWNRVKANVTVTMLQIGRFLAPYVAELVDRVGALFGKIATWWNENGPAIIAKVIEVRDAIAGFIERVAPLIKSWVEDNLNNVSRWWADHGPKIVAAANLLKDTMVLVAEGIIAAVGWIIENWDKLRWAVGAAVAVMIPHFIALGAQAVLSAIKQVGAWVLTAAKAVWAAAVHSAQIIAMIAGWALVGAKALVHAAKVVAAWVLTSVNAVKAVIIMGVQAAIFVAKWAFMGAQALVHAARIAAAWLIAMGPIAIVIAAVAALVYVIIRNWDTIKSTISNGWNAVKNFTSSAWESIKSAVSNAVTAVVGFIARIPSLAIGALGNLGSLLYNKGEELIQGFINGVKNMAGSAASAVASAIPGGGIIKGALSKIPGLAVGARNFQGGLAVVGEEGPELVRLPRGTDVYTNGESKKMVAAAAPAGDGDSLSREDLLAFAEMLIDGITDAVGSAAEKSARTAVQTMRAS